jgi:predicted class III extradiol MEMO1 family dioxygenase
MDTHVSVVNVFILGFNQFGVCDLVDVNRGDHSSTPLGYLAIMLEFWLHVLC